jgi:hypothetical protein
MSSRAMRRARRRDRDSFDLAGRAGIAKNTITIGTTRKGPADRSGARETATIEAKRPE